MAIEESFFGRIGGKFMALTREELKAVHNNIMTVMENRIMLIARCDRKTANLIANEVLNLDREADHILNEGISTS